MRLPATIQRLLPSKQARPGDDYKPVAAIGLTLIVVTFGILGLWAALAPLGSAVSGHGVVSTDSSRQTVQHLEGGIIRTILVREGDVVKEGQVLFELDPVQAKATLDIARNELFSFASKAARLEAERDHRSSVDFPPEVTSQAQDPVVARAMSDEMRQFSERRSTLQGQDDILKSRIAQYQTQIEGIDLERKSMVEQIGYLSDEIGGLSDLYKQDLVPKSRLLSLERDRAQLQGQEGHAIAERSQTQKAIGEAELQERQLRQQFDQDVSKELGEVQTQLGDIRQKYAVAQDTARRIDVPAPMGGTIQNLRFTTVGAVVRPGEPLVDIAPDQGAMIIKAQFSPNDVDSVHAGQTVEIRFTTFHQRNIPVIQGVIHTVSQDRLVDEATHQPYYLAIVRLQDAKMPTMLRDRIRAGLPAEIIVPTGSRTALQYLLQPLSNAMQKTMREQ